MISDDEPSNPSRRRLISQAYLLALLVVAPALGAAAGATGHAGDVVVLLDNSGSMLENDPERLLKPAVIELIHTLPSNLRISVIGFDRAPEALVGLSDQDVDLEGALTKIDYTGQLTNTPAALERAIYELRTARETADSRDIVLITDGIVDLGDTAETQRAEDWLIGALLQSAVREGIRIHAIAFTEGADYRVLQGVTEATGGSYYRAPDIPALKEVLHRIRSVLEHAGSASPEPMEAPAIQPVVTILPPAAPVPPTMADPEPVPVDSSLRWWVVTLAMLAMVGVAGGAVAVTILLHQRREGVAPRPNERLEYFPECYLVDLDGVTPSMRHELKRTNNIISRLKKPPDDGMNYIYIPRPSIGRRHALIEFRNLTFWIKDLGSVNGTRLNGRRINTETRLKHGDRIKFHTYEFEFSVADLAFSEPTEPAWQS